MSNSIMNSDELQVSAANGSEKAGNGGLALSGSGSVGEITVPPDKSNGKAVDWAATKCRDRFNRQDNPAASVVVKRVGYADVTIHKGDSADGRKDKLRAGWAEPTNLPPEPSEREPVPSDGSTPEEATTPPPELSGIEDAGLEGSTPDEDWKGYRTAPLPAPGFDLGGGLQGRNNPALAEASARVLMLGASETLVAATSYAAMGWRVLPLAAGSKVPPAGFKWKDDKSSDPHTLAGWFDDGEFFGCGKFAGGNIAIATGTTDADYDLVVLDVDVKGGKDGYAVLKAAEAEHGVLPETLMAWTPSGGEHRVYKVPKGSWIGSSADVFGKYGKGLDVRGIGGYIGASPSVVGGKSYQWRNDVLPAELPDVWVKALQAECPAGGERGAVSGSSNGGRVQVVRGELLPTPEDVRAALEEHAVPSNVKRDQGWLQVLSVLSAFEGGEALARKWSSTGGYADRFNAADFDHGWAEVHGNWNHGSGAPMDVGTLFNLVKAHSPEWQTPAARRAAQAKADQEKPTGFPGLGAMPDYLQKPVTPSLPVDAVSDDRAFGVLDWVKVKADAVSARVQAGEDVGHDDEWLFIDGMLTTNPDRVKYQVEHNPIPKGRSSPYQTSKGTIRAVIMHTDGSRPSTPEAVDMSRFAPDWAGGTADAAARLVNRVMLARDATLGEKPTPGEAALVHRTFELSPLGKWWAENASAISTQRNGWSLKSAVDNGLSRAKRYNTNTHAAVSGSGSGFDFSAANNFQRGGAVVDVQLPEGVGFVPAFDAAVERVQQGTITEEQCYMAVMQTMNCLYAKVLVGGKAVVVRSVYDQAIRRNTNEFIPLKELAGNYAHKRLQTGTNTKGTPIIKDAFSAWNVWAGCRAYSAVVFNPKGDSPADAFNTWEGFTTDPVEGKHLLGRLMHHLEHVICSGDEAVFEYVLDWLAALFQRPHEPAGSSIVCRGRKGVGKGVMSDFIKSLCGRHGVQVNRPEHLVGKFNAHLAEAVFLVADEAFFAGDPAAVGVLNERITEPTFLIERKGIDPVKHENTLHTWMNTNEDFAVPATADERRYCVTDVSSKYKGDRDYFTALKADMNSEEVRAAFLYEMLNRDISQFFASHIPETGALKDQRAHNLKTPAAWLLDCLTEGYILPADGAVGVQASAWGEVAMGENEASTEHLYSRYLTWCDQMKTSSFHRVSRRVFGAYMKRVFTEKLVGQRRVSGVYLGTLDDAVSRFEQLEKIRVLRTGDDT